MAIVAAVIEPVSFAAQDGVVLVGQRSSPAPAVPLRASAVLCHPHPQFGGSMQSLVISPLFEALPALGVDVLRFNFRGVGASLGTFDNGVAEQLDVVAALDEQRNHNANVPLVLIGFSFGADVALSVTAPEIDSYCAIAPPLRFGSPELLGSDARYKTVILADHDEFRDPTWVRDRISSWTNTNIEVVAGANHFFVARTDNVIAAISTHLTKRTSIEPRGVVTTAERSMDVC